MIKNIHPEMTAEEYNKIVYEWNQTEAPYPKDKTIHQLFEEQVERTPDNIAVVFEDKSLTYRELNEKSNQLAHTLRKLYREHIGEELAGDTLIGIYIGRSLEMIIGILGILKAGGAYVPIASDYPESRVNYIIKDCGIKFIITDNTSFIQNSSLCSCIFYNGQEECQQTDMRNRITNIDSLPLINRSMIDLEKYNKSIGEAHFRNYISLFTSRGCPYKCAFCHKIWGKKTITRSAENIYSELKLYYDAGYRNFAILDDIFNLDVKNSSRFFNLLIENNLRVQIAFPTGIRGDILTEDYIDLMIRAGTVHISLALETASERLQKLIRKNLDIRKLKKNLNYIATRYPNVILDLFLMSGFPTETEEEAIATINFVKDIKWLHFPLLSFLHIYPNTDMEKIYLQATAKTELPGKSTASAFHEKPETLPYSFEFAEQLKTDFLSNYILNKERLIKVLPSQLRIMGKEALLKKYNTYLGISCRSITELLVFLKISEDKLNISSIPEFSEDKLSGVNEKIKISFPEHKADSDALKILLLDLTLNFDSEKNQLNDMIEQPLGLLYIMTYLKETYKNKVDGKIAKSNIDFSSYNELKTILYDYKPDIIGIRSLSYYKNFFHKTAAFIRGMGINVPIIAGGPYATSEYRILLNDTNIDIAVIGEGEITFSEIIHYILDNDKKLPDTTVLKNIKGIAYNRKNKKSGNLKTLLLNDNRMIEKALRTNPEHINKSNDLAYVIYTSGSTGNPKGVMVEHRNVLNFTINNNYCSLNSQTVAVSFSSHTFDGSIFDIFSILLNGGKTVLPLKETFLNFLLLDKIITENKVNTAFVTTAFFNLCCNEKQNNLLLKLRYVLFGGEKVNKDKVMDFISFSNNTILMHVYGPTETTVYATKCNLGSAGVCPIGSALKNTTLYILNSTRHPIPIGVPGELYIGGDGLARGYLNRPDLTEERFIPNPFVTEEEHKKGRNLRIYKTGDICRWLPDGNIEYIGRNDDQVKIRGFRIELGEIESKLSSYPDVGLCVVLAKEINREKQVCAYYTVNSKLKIQNSKPDDLREFLSNLLPDYMIPSFFTELEEMPLNTSGKIDRKKLPEPEMAGNDENYEAPSTETEKKLCEIWTDLLGIEKIGINNSFFHLGGNSLKIVQLGLKISSVFGKKISAGEVFKAKTVKEQAKLIDGKRESASLKIKRVPDMPDYPVLNAQKRMYLVNKLEGNSTAYNIPLIYKTANSFDSAILKEALNKIIEKQESLRTYFIETEDGIRQKIKGVNEFIIEIEEKEFPANKINSALTAFVRPFDLNKAPLWRTAVYRESGGNGTYLLFDFHHIIFDGQSVDIFLEELLKAFEGKELKEPEARVRDYAFFEEEFTRAEEYTKQEEFWLKELSGELPEVTLPYDRKRPKEKDYKGDSVRLEIGREICQKMSELEKSSELTSFMIMFAAYNILLSKYSGSEDIITGIPTLGRKSGDVMSSIGMFVGTLPVRTNISVKLSAKEYFAEVKEKVVSAVSHDAYPLEDMVNKLNIERKAGHTLFFDTMFALWESGNEKLLLGKESFAVVDKEVTTEQFDLTGYVYEKMDKTEIVFSYASSLFEKNTIERLANHYINILETVLLNPDTLIGDIQLMGKTEYQTVVYDWNQTEAPYPKDKIIHQLFEEQVEKTPGNTAIVFEDKSLTYRELNEKANQLAHTLRKLYREHIGEELAGDTLIGIYIDRSLEMIIGILGILKAGGAYVPFDSADPEGRLKFKINDCGCKVVLTSQEMAKDLVFLTESDTLPLSIDSYWSEIEKQPKSNPEHINQSNNLAYIIYTSGSTGQPKGVMIEHRNVINLFYTQYNCFEIGNNEKILQFSSICFDASVEQLMLALLSGNALYIANDNLKRDPLKLENYIKDQNITHFHATPSYINIIRKINGTSLKRVIAGGELCDLAIVDEFINVNFINEYGPTETTVTSIQYFYDRKDASYLPIGKPIGNTTVYIFDFAQKPVPVGVQGELYIGGDGLARGYLNRPDLTAERFIPNPFATEEDREKGRNLRIYKTGDICRWLPDGNIEYIGRNDDQVKIRGFRIELGEIESKISSHPDVGLCAVLAKEVNGEKQLCAYYTVNSKLKTQNLKPDDLREFLTNLLPDYMVPSFFTELEEMPLNTSGKIDRKKLPEPDTGFSDAEFIPPRHPGEIQIFNIWQEVLGLDRISVNQDFFSSGGNSLNAVRLAYSLGKMAGKQIPVLFVFENRTIEKQAYSIYQYLLSGGGRDIAYIGNRDAEKVIVMYPPIASGAEAYYELGKMLDENILLLGINSYYLNYPDEIADDMNSFFDYYYRKTIESGCLDKKEIYLGGWSLGGNVTVKISEKLRREGYDIKGLILLDSVNSKEMEEPETEDEGLLKPSHPFYERYVLAGGNRERYENFIKLQSKYQKNAGYKPTDIPAHLIRCIEQLADGTQEQIPHHWENILLNSKEYTVSGKHMNMMMDKETVRQTSEIIKNIIKYTENY